MEPKSPWLFPYLSKEKPRRGKEIYRPALRASMLGPLGATPYAFALVDSGSEYTLAAPWVPQTIGSETSDPLEIGIGGRPRWVQFAPITMRISQYGTDDEHYIEWDLEVGFFKEWEPPWTVLFGQIGFFDRFTVTMHRAALTLAIEDGSIFDDRFGPLIATDNGR